MASSATFKFYRGETFARSFVYRAAGVVVNLTGKAVSFHLLNSQGKTVLSFSSATPATETGGITITDASAGAFSLKVADEATAAFSFNRGSWWIGLEDSGDVRVIGRGEAIEGFPK